MKEKKEKKAYNQLQTPCYVIHKWDLEQGVKSLKDALEKYWNNYHIGYSFKTNALPWVLEFMKEQGLWAEVVSADEYSLAKKMKYDQMIYNGPVKTKESFCQAALGKNIVNIDSKQELEWIEEVEKPIAMIGLRVNFDLEALCPGETTAGEEGSRFGFSYEKGELQNAILRLRKNGIKIAGLHLHTSTKTRSVKIYCELARMACVLKREFQLDLEYIDIGGGFFGGMENKPQFVDYIKCISEQLAGEFDPEKTALIVEPGTSVITAPIEYVTTVIDCKENYASNIVVTDGSRIDIDPLHRKSSYFYQLHYQTENDEVLSKQIICGFTCMEDDRLFVLENANKLQPGDQISYQKVGGYTMCLTPLFIRYFPNVYVEENREYHCVRRAWTAEEYVQGSMK